MKKYFGFFLTSPSSLASFCLLLCLNGDLVFSAPLSSLNKFQSIYQSMKEIERIIGSTAEVPDIYASKSSCDKEKLFERGACLLTQSRKKELENLEKETQDLQFHFRILLYERKLVVIGSSLQNVFIPTLQKIRSPSLELNQFIRRFQQLLSPSLLNPNSRSEENLHQFNESVAMYRDQLKQLNSQKDTLNKSELKILNFYILWAKNVRIKVYQVDYDPNQYPIRAASAARYLGYWNDALIGKLDTFRITAEQTFNFFTEQYDIRIVE